MKKIFLTVAIVAAMMTAACSADKKAADEGASMKSKIENCTNPDSLKVYVANAKAYYDQLVASGKLDEAKKYMDQIEPVVKEKAPSLAGAFETLKSGVEALSDKAGDAASAAGDSISAAAGEAKDAIADKAQDVKDAAAEKAQDIKDAAAKKAQEAKDKAAKGIQDGADKLKDALK